MRLTLSIRKTLEDNASQYFEQAKKAKRKLEGAKRAMQRVAARKPVQRQLARRRKDWYEQYRWTKTADGTLIIAGKDASSNEALIKKRMQPADTVLHADIPGSPFVLIKGPATHDALDAAAMLAAAYSRAWRQGLSTIDVFWVRPEQVTKTPNTGEYLAKGGFVIRGEKHYLRPELALSVGVLDNAPAAGTQALFELKEAAYATLKPGAEDAAALSKKLAKRLGFSSDDWQRILPSGGCVMTSIKHKNTRGDTVQHG